MPTAATPAEVIRELIAEHQSLGGLEINESETRLRFVDRILEGVLGWRRDQFHPETYAGDRSGAKEWLDYWLKGGPVAQLVVEAKALGRSFYFSPKRRQTKVSLQTLRSNHGQELQDALKQAIGYCTTTHVPSFVVTNGVQWICSIASWPHTEASKYQAVVFYDLQDVEDNLEMFVDLLSAQGLTRQTLLEQALEGENIIPQFAKSINQALHNNPQPEKSVNYLSAPIENLMTLCFDKLQGEDKEDMLRYCYVKNELTEGYFARLENFVGQTRPLDLRDAPKVDRTKPIDDVRSGPLPKAIRGGGEALLLVGQVGSGKSTFLEHAILNLRSTLHDELVVLNLDLLPKTQTAAPRFDHDNFRAELCQQLLEQAEVKYPALHPTSWDNLKGIFSAEVQRELSALPPSLRESSDARINDVIQRLREDKYLHLRRYLRYLRVNRGIAVTVVFDNIDQSTEEFERFVYVFARALTDDTGVTTITSLRETTYSKAKANGFLDVSQNVVFTIAPPPFIEVASKRFNFARNRLANDATLMAHIERGVDGFNINRVIEFCEILADVVLGSTRDIQECIQALAGTNVRDALYLLRLFSISSNTNIETLRKDHAARRFAQTLDVFLHSIMRGRRLRYDSTPADQPIVNLFQVDARRITSHFTGVRILQYLTSVVNTPHQDQDVPIPTLVDAVVATGHKANDVRTVIDRLGKKRLLFSRTKPMPPWGDGDSVRISSAGNYYLTTMIRSREYLENLSDDVLLYDAKSLDSLLFAHNDRTDGWRHRYERKLRILLHYLYQRERQELSRAGIAGPANHPWLEPVVQDLGERIFGTELFRSPQPTQRQTPSGDGGRGRRGHRGGRRR